jgi:hypothetical protein
MRPRMGTLPKFEISNSKSFLECGKMRVNNGA